MSRDVIKEIETEVKANKVLLYMKGSPEQPMCGFSYRVVQILNEVGKPYAYVNILADQEKREAVKQFGSWPTFPQLYVNGELVGGCDIVTELHESKELGQMLEDSPVAS
ncbi:MAG: monothiol glutaredoxin, Grx4 family [Candidatus Melainabacteria bacterium HGW-Melainabacteria-1]|nr:MAG: monothiol glutaredoxin, Grx4 family [Candidatus Melainabacteria bacterium HGW-Melainabacteria-1]